MMTLRRGRPVSESKGGHVVDYRHVIHALRKKPMALNQSCLPRSAVPASGLCTSLRGIAPERGRQARCKLTVELLALAHDRGCEAELARPSTPNSIRAGCRILRYCANGSVQVQHRMPAVTVAFVPLRPTMSSRRSMPSSPLPTWRPWHDDDNTVDAARVELLLSELRLPGVKLIWAKLAEQSDKEGWPAARFLAALAEHEIADRGRRRIERHLVEARLPVGKTLATFDFEAVPMVSKLR